MVVMAAIPTVAAAQTFSGVLDANDPLWEDSRPYDSYTVQVEQFQQVTVRMESPAFDTYLIVRGPNDETYSNDDFESQSVSQVEFVAPSGGTWTILASAYSTDMGGAYTVEVTLGAKGDVRTIEGRLTPNDEESLKGEYFDTHSVEIDGNSPFTVELTSYGFDGYLVVRAPDGRTWRNDDADSTELSRVGPLSGAGTWTVFVTSSSAEQVGAYDLRIIRFP